jgi:hypothetical protein
MTLLSYHFSTQTPPQLRHVSCHATWFLWAFAKLRKPTINFVMTASLSVWPHGTTWLSVEEFSRTLIFEDFSEICRLCSSIIRIWQE